MREDGFGFPILLCLPLFFSLLYSVFALFLVLSFKKKHPHRGDRSRSTTKESNVSVCVLRPLVGAHVESYSCLATLCKQTVLPAEIRYGIDGGADPALAVVRQLIQDFSKIPMSVHIGFDQEGTNRKIAKLSLLAKHCRTPFIAAIDQDITLPPDHLQEVVSCFSDLRVGMVTALYHLANPETLGSALELLMVHASFFPAVLIAEQLEGGLRFAFGATMAFRSNVLEKIGGFQSVRDYLADDHELGGRVSKAGYRVALSGSIVQHNPGKLSFKDYWLRGIRAARTHRAMRPLGYAFSLFTQGSPWILLFFLVFGFKKFVLEVVLSWSVMEVLLAVASHRVLTREKRKWWPFFFLPLHEIFRFIFWVLAFTGNTVIWGERQYRITRNGKMGVAG